MANAKGVTVIGPATVSEGIQFICRVSRVHLVVVFQRIFEARR